MRFGAYYQFKDGEFIEAIGQSTESFEEWVELMKYTKIPEERLKALYETVKPYEHIIGELAFFSGDFVIYFKDDGTIGDMVRLFEEFKLNPEVPFDAEFDWHPHSLGFFMKLIRR